MLNDFPHSVGLLSREMTDDPTPTGNALDGVLEAYREQGYQAGYTRALNDVLADFLMFTQRHLRHADPADRDRLRHTLQQFEMELETSLTTRDGRVDPFVEGGLGI